jgi:hypothetical protein
MASIMGAPLYFATNGSIAFSATASGHTAGTAQLR